MVKEVFIGLRTFRSTKEMIEAAADVKGATVSEFVENAAIRDARITLYGDRSSRRGVSND